MKTQNNQSKSLSMKKYLLTFLASIFLTLLSQGQFNFELTVLDNSSSDPIQGATVVFNSVSQETDENGQVTFANLSNGEYMYTVSKDCYLFESFSASISDGDLAENVNLTAETTNSVFFFVGSPFTLSDATVTLVGPNGYNESIVTGNLLGDVFENVPFGEYTYTIAKDCYETLSGSVTVECLGGGQGASVSENPVEITINSDVELEGNVLTAQSDMGEFQWIDCDSGESIEGATTAEFTAEANGNFAVVITVDNCSVTSECVEVISVGTSNISELTGANIYPNPCTSSLNMELPNIEGTVSLRIFSITGQLVHREVFTSANSNVHRLLMSDFERGVYILEMEIEGSSYIKKVIKQ